MVWDWDMSIDPFVVFVVVLTLVIGIGGLLIDAYGREPRAGSGNRNSRSD